MSTLKDPEMVAAIRARRSVYGDAPGIGDRHPDGGCNCGPAGSCALRPVGRPSAASRVPPATASVSASVSSRFSCVCLVQVLLYRVHVVSLRAAACEPSDGAPVASSLHRTSTGWTAPACGWRTIRSPNRKTDRTLVIF